MCALLPYVRHNYPLTFLFRRRSYVCGIWGYKYSGTSKNTGMEWNARYTNFVPFLCGLTESLVPLLKKICSLEVASKLLFQRPMSEIQQVFGLFLFMFRCVSSCQFSFLLPDTHHFEHAFPRQRCCSEEVLRQNASSQKEVSVLPVLPYFGEVCI